MIRKIVISTGVVTTSIATDGVRLFVTDVMYQLIRTI